MHAQNRSPAPRFSRAAIPWRALGGVLLSLVLLWACDSAGSGNGSGPPEEDTSAFRTVSVTVESDTLDLPGTLFVPDTSAAVPGVVIVHGSGPVGRGGPVPEGGRVPIYERWANRLADRGVAVLRYDKRTTRPGVRQADPRAITFLDFVRDAVAAAELLAGRQEVDAHRLVLVGHSQGGNVAPAAATRLDGVAGVASLAGPALAVDSLLVAQLRANGGGTGCTASRTRAQFDSLRAGQPVSNGLICGAGTTFWRQWIRHTQRLDSVVAAMDPPLLAQQGRADQNYPGETLQRNLDAWRRIARAEEATVEAYEGVDHLFLRAGSTTTADAPLRDLLAWIRER